MCPVWTPCTSVLEFMANLRRKNIKQKSDARARVPIIHLLKLRNLSTFERKEKNSIINFIQSGYERKSPTCPSYLLPCHHSCTGQ